MRIKKLCAVIMAVILSMTALAAVPVCAADADGIVLGVNGLDTYGSEGHSLILTRKTGMNIPDVGTYFTWWRIAVFEYSDEADAYIVTALSLQAAQHPKMHTFPKTVLSSPSISAMITAILIIRTILQQIPIMLLTM